MIAICGLDTSVPLEIKTIVSRYRDLRLEPVTREDVLNKAILIIFPDISIDDARTSSFRWRSRNRPSLA
jgi:hypothetical protein